MTYRLRFLTGLGFCAIWLLALLGNGKLTSAAIAREQFEMLSAIALGACLVAGIFLTADCLSSEKREGTLGLLFLTDLRGYDVVLGKLAATSLQSAYALLAMLPVMALPLLMGGVTQGEFWRMVLVLLAALFFSLATGVAMSAVSREARKAMSATAAVVLIFSALLPALGNLLTLSGHRPNAILFFWASAGFADQLSTDLAYPAGYRGYWGSLATLVGLGLAGLCFGSMVLPRTWQERGNATEGSVWRRWRFGSAAARVRQRVRLLARNPFEWLARRDHLVGWAAVFLFTVGLPLWGACFVVAFRSTRAASMDGFSMLIFSTFAIQLLAKGLMTLESTRRLSEDRESGALELLLATPLRATQILLGQARATRAQFALTRAILLLLYSGIIWFRYGPNPMKMSDNHETMFIFVGNGFMLGADFFAYNWLGMWLAMHYRHHRAVMTTLALVHLPSWGAFLAAGACGLLDGRTGFQSGIFYWTLFSCVWSIGLALWSRRRLHRDFNELAAGIKKPVRRWGGLRAGLPAKISR